MPKSRVQLMSAIAVVFLFAHHVDAVEIESSIPPNYAIDARNPFVQGAAELQGWQSIEIRFQAAVTGVIPSDFTVSETGGDGIPPTVIFVTPIDARTVLVGLSESIEPGSWLDLTYAGSIAGISLGYLPGDVNGDGTVSPALDMLAFVDCINLPGRCAAWQQDIDRNSVAQGQADQQMLLDLLRGTGGNTAWAGARMPQNALAALTQTPRTQRNASSGTLVGTDEIEIRLNVTDLGPTEFGSVNVFDPGAFTTKLGVQVNPNDQLLLHIWARNNTAKDIHLRLVQFDPRASSFPYALLGSDINTGNQPLDGVPNLWFDYSELAPNGMETGLFPADGTAVSSSTGSYADFSNTLAGNPLTPAPPATAFLGFSGDPVFTIQIPMPSTQWVHLGALPMTVPTGTTSYEVDVLNPANTDVNFGARIDFGFGVEPNDSVTFFSTAPGADGSIAYASVGECGGPIQYDGVLQQFRPSVLGCCGNGIVETGEECDDGNPVSGDGCDQSCVIENGACCLGTGCSLTTEADCQTSGGTFSGVNTDCNVPDSDGDGLGDACDACPSDGNKIEPGLCGCGVSDVDTDGDGTVDCNDNCPTDSNKVNPGQCGCGNLETDTDSDGTADCNDNCPADSNKVNPGQCGCGILETDTDGDGTADCNDNCPADLNKVDPGLCGCGVSDVDTDGDGTADCVDNCPSDLTKVNPGQCGCGNLETDTDSDGTADCNDLCPGVDDNIYGDCTAAIPTISEWGLLVLTLLLLVAGKLYYSRQPQTL